MPSALSASPSRDVCIANLHRARVILRAIQHEHLAVAHDGCGIEGVQRLPVRGCLKNGIGECRSLAGRDHRIPIRRAQQTAQSPIALPSALVPQRQPQQSRQDHHPTKHHAQLHPSFCLVLVLRNVKTQCRVPLFEQPRAHQTCHIDLQAALCVDVRQSPRHPPSATPLLFRPASPTQSYIPPPLRRVDQEIPDRTRRFSRSRPSTVRTLPACTRYPADTPSRARFARSTSSAAGARSTNINVRRAAAQRLNPHRARSGIQIQKSRALNPRRQHIEQASRAAGRWSAASPVPRGACSVRERNRPAMMRIVESASPHQAYFDYGP